MLLIKYKLEEHHISAILDDRKDLGIGNRIKDVYVLGTPKMIVIGKKFDGIHYSVEDTKTGIVDSVNISDIIDYFEKNGKNR